MIRSFFRRLFEALIVLVLLGSVASAIPIGNFLIELNQNLGGYYFVASLIILPVLVYFRSWLRATIAFVFIIYFAAIIFPFYFAPTNPQKPVSIEGQRSLRLMFVRDYSPEFQKVLVDSNPDLLALTAPESAGLKTVTFGDLPFSAETTVLEGKRLMLFSRFPIEGAGRDDLGDFSDPVLIRTVNIGDETKLAVTVFRFPLAYSRDRFSIAKVMKRRITTYAKHIPGPQLVIAEMNGTQFTSLYRGVVARAKLLDSFYGFGMKRTWEKGSLQKRFTLDYALYKGPIEIEKADTIAIDGASHLSLLVDLKIGKLPLIASSSQTD